MIVPGDLIRRRDDAMEGSYRLGFTRDETETPLTIDPKLETSGELLVLSVDRNLLASSLVELQRFRDADELEDIFAVTNRTNRSENGDAQETVFVTEMIGREQLSRAEDGMWRVRDTALSRDVCHGAPVLSASDEQIVGMLLVSEEATWTSPLPAGPVTRY